MPKRKMMATYVSSEIYKRVVDLASMEDRSVSYIVRLAILSYLDNLTSPKQQLKRIIGRRVVTDDSV